MLTRRRPDQLEPIIVQVASPAVKEMERYLPRGVINAINQVDATFDSQKLLEAIIHHFGGPEKFAYQVVQEFKSAPKGTLVRQRILEMVNRLTMNVSSNAPPSKNVGDMDDDELAEAAARAVAVIDRKEKLRVLEEASSGQGTLGHERSGEQGDQLGGDFEEEEPGGTEGEDQSSAVGQFGFDPPPPGEEFGPEEKKPGYIGKTFARRRGRPQ